MEQSPAIGDALHRLLHAYKRAMRESHAESGIELPIMHIRALKGIARVPNCTAQTIADRMRRDKAQIARAIKDLIADSLIQRHPHPDDQRSQCLRLTPTGQALVERIARNEIQAGLRMAEGLSDAQMQDFVRLAEAMSVNLEQ